MALTIITESPATTPVFTCLVEDLPLRPKALDRLLSELYDDGMTLFPLGLCSLSAILLARDELNDCFAFLVMGFSEDVRLLGADVKVWRTELPWPEMEGRLAALVFTYEIASSRCLMISLFSSIGSILSSFSCRDNLYTTPHRNNQKSFVIETLV